MPDKASVEALLLLCLVQEHRHLDMVLAGFLELGISDAWVAEVQGMGQVLSVDVPIFAGLRSLFPASAGDGYLITAVVSSDMAGPVAAVVEDVCGPWGREGAATLITVSVASYLGPSPFLGDS